MNIILINGHVGCLKTTLSYYLSANFNLGHVSTSNLGYFTSDKDHPDFLKYREERYAKLYQLTEACLKNDISVVLDGNFPYNKWRKEIFNLSKKYEVESIVSIKCICSDLELIEKRMSFRRKNKSAPDSDSNSIDNYLNSVKVYEKFHNDFIENEKLSRLEFDSGQFQIEIIENRSKFAIQVFRFIKALLDQKILEQSFYIAFDEEG